MNGYIYKDMLYMAMLPGRSMHRLKSSGPRIGPCGTPEKLLSFKTSEDYGLIY